MKNCSAIFLLLLRMATALVAGFWMPATANAAEIHPDPSVAAGRGAVLEGNIQAGDFDKFRRFVLENDKTAEIYLASPGGNLGEAWKIGILTRALNLTTVAPSKTPTNHAFDLTVRQHDLQHSKANYMCASACFFIFVAGINRRSDGLGPVILGIHRPVLSESDKKRLEYDQVATLSEQMRSNVAHYLKAMDVPSQYALEMFSVPPKRVRWIRNDEFESDFRGIVPALREKFIAKCGMHANLEGEGDKQRPDTMTSERDPSQGMASELSSKQQALLACERDFEAEMVRHARGQDNIGNTR